MHGERLLLEAQPSPEEQSTQSLTGTIFLLGRSDGLWWHALHGTCKAVITWRAQQTKLVRSAIRPWPDFVTEVSPWSTNHYHVHGYRSHLRYKWEALPRKLFFMVPQHYGYSNITAQPCLWELKRTLCWQIRSVIEIWTDLKSKNMEVLLRSILRLKLDPRAINK